MSKSKKKSTLTKRVYRNKHEVGIKRFFYSIHVPIKNLYAIVLAYLYTKSSFGFLFVCFLVYLIFFKSFKMDTADWLGRSDPPLFSISHKINICLNYLIVNSLMGHLKWIKRLFCYWIPLCKSLYRLLNTTPKRTKHVLCSTSNSFALSSLVCVLIVSLS